MSLSFTKLQYEEAFKAVAELRKEGVAAKKEGHEVKAFERELKRQENRHKMDKFDGASLKKMEEEKKEGTD